MVRAALGLVRSRRARAIQLAKKRVRTSVDEFSCDICAHESQESVIAHAQSIFQVVPTPNGHHGPLNNNLLAVAASTLPAMRAASIEPMRALRGE